MTRFLIVGVVVAVIFWVISIVDCAVQPANRHRGVAKGGWLAIVVLLPVIGGVLWFAVGRVGKLEMMASVAPDDNPEFLSTLGSVANQNERIRLLEEELARLDDEDAGPIQRPSEPSAADDADADSGEDNPDDGATPRGSADTAS